MKPLIEPFPKLQFLVHGILISTRSYIVWNIYGHVWTSLEKTIDFCHLSNLGWPQISTTYITERGKKSCEKNFKISLHIEELSLFKNTSNISLNYKKCVLYRQFKNSGNNYSKNTLNLKQNSCQICKLLFFFFFCYCPAFANSSLSYLQFFHKIVTTIVSF